MEAGGSKEAEEAMSEEKPIPTEMLNAATGAIKELSPRVWVWTGLKPATVAEAALRAAGVPKLAARIRELEAALATHQESSFHPDWSLLEATRASPQEHWAIIQAKDARIAELEATIETLSEEAEDHLEKLGC